MQRINIKKMSLAFALMFVIIGCEEPSPNTKKGALIGAAGGAVVAGASGGNVARGAVAGAVVGGTVGYLSDQ